MIKIEVNNNRTLEIAYDYDALWTLVTTKDSRGNVERVYGIEDGEMVMLLNYFRYQKDNGLEIF